MVPQSHDPRAKDVMVMSDHTRRGQNMQRATGQLAENHVAREWNRTRCLQVVGAFFINMNTIGTISSFGVFQTYYALNGSPPSTVSWIGSTQAYLMFVLSIFAGPAFDAGYMKTLIWAGSLLTVLGVFMTSLCSELWQCFLAQGLVMGVGIGLLYVSAPSLVGMHFKRHRALAMGITSAGGGIGGTIFPIIFDEVRPRLGFAWATRILAFLMLATSIIPLLTVAYPKPAVAINDLGRAEQLVVDTRLSERPLAGSWKQMFRAIIDTTALKERPWLVGVFSLLLSITGLYTVLYYINLWAFQRHLTKYGGASSMLLIINTASLLGRTAVVGIADYIGHALFLSINMLVSGIMVFCLLSPFTQGGSIAWSICYGITSGAGHAVVGAVIVSLSENSSRIGSRQGMALGLVGHGMLISGPIGGAILDSTAGWTGIICWCALSMTLGALLAGWAWWAKACRHESR